MANKLKLVTFATGAMILALRAWPGPAIGDTSAIKEVRHELVMLPRYGVFDNIAFKVDGGKVTLFGQVREPVLKSDAGKAVQGIEGITEVDNKIEVLPLSPADDQTRRAVYQAVYGDSGLSRYAFQAVPSIHIIVKNGHVTLEGVVANTMDRDIAYIRANSVAAVFSVADNLRLDS